jgi:hypothetical protein
MLSDFDYRPFMIRRLANALYEAIHGCPIYKKEDIKFVGNAGHVYQGNFRG